MDYRVYLLDADKRIVAAEAFMADSDAGASEIALALHASCSDAYETCEVWRGETCIFLSSSANLRRWDINLREMRRDRQERLLELEEALDSTFACLRESEALLASYQELRKGLRSGD